MSYIKRKNGKKSSKVTRAIILFILSNDSKSIQFFFYASEMATM
jgi:hypothetical protein